MFQCICFKHDTDRIRGHHQRMKRCTCTRIRVQITSTCINRVEESLSPCRRKEHIDMKCIHPLISLVNNKNTVKLIEQHNQTRILDTPFRPSTNVFQSDSWTVSTRLCHRYCLHSPAQSHTHSLLGVVTFISKATPNDLPGILYDSNGYVREEHPRHQAIWDE